MGTSLASLNINSSTASQGTGIDVTAVVDAIISSEQAPETIWKQQQATLALQASSLNSLGTGVTALQSKIFALSDLSGVFSGQTVTSSQPGVVTASAQPGTATGTHTVVVDHLATVSSYYTDPTPAGSTLTHGTFTIGVGTGSKAVTIDSSNDTVATLASYINSNNYGVTASVLTDASGSRLALVSNTSGLPGDVNVTANNTGLVFHKSVAGVNAGYSLDGIPLTSTTNTVSAPIPGVTLNLVSASPGTPVTVSVAPDTAGITQAINDFVSAYNSSIQSINSQFTTAADGTAGALASNSALGSLQSSLLSDATFSVTGNNGIVNLASLGIDLQNDGTLTVDSAKLSSALSSNFTDVQNFFQSANAGSFGAHFSGDLSSISDPSTGLLALNLSENTANQKDLTNQINNLEDRLVDRRTFLINEYSQVDAMLRQYPLTIQQIQTQLGTLSTGK